MTLRPANHLANMRTRILKIPFALDPVKGLRRRGAKVPGHAWREQSGDRNTEFGIMEEEANVRPPQLTVHVRSIVIARC